MVTSVVGSAGSQRQTPNKRRANGFVDFPDVFLEPQLICFSRSLLVTAQNPNLMLWCPFGLTIQFSTYIYIYIFIYLFVYIYTHLQYIHIQGILIIVSEIPMFKSQRCHCWFTMAKSGEAFWRAWASPLLSFLGSSSYSNWLQRPGRLGWKHDWLVIMEMLEMWWWRWW